jgi:hypothetical protein
MHKGPENWSSLSIMIKDGFREQEGQQNIMELQFAILQNHFLSDFSPFNIL